MSDYVRIKAVRFKIDDAIVKSLEKEIKEKDLFESPQELLLKQYKLPDWFEHKLNEFTINNGYDFDNHKENLFLDYMLDYEYGASGDFESVRLLTDNEFNKYRELFSKYFNVVRRDELRLVHYCYYNGVDEPLVWELEEI